MIKNISIFLNRYIVEIKYLFFGILTATINYISFYLMVEFLGKEHTLFSNGVSFILATLFAFCADKFIVFESSNKSALLSELFSFTVARIGTFLLEQLGMLIVVSFITEDISILGIDIIYLSKIFLSGLATLLNYLISKFLIFKEG